MTVLLEMSSLPRPISYRIIFQLSIIRFYEHERVNSKSPAAKITSPAKNFRIFPKPRSWIFLTFPKMALFGLKNLIRDNVRYFDICFPRQEWKFMHFQTIISLFHHVNPQSNLDFVLENVKNISSPADRIYFVTNAH